MERAPAALSPPPASPHWLADTIEDRMSETFLIGLDFGSESARGLLIEASTGRQAAYHVHAYRHGIMTEALPGGRRLPAGFALQVAADYLEAAEIILTAIGAGRNVAGIGVDFTASSPMPALADGRPMSEVTPDDPHAYVKLWKHAAAQSYAEAINAGAGSYLANFGGKVSGEWLLAKAAQIAAEAPDVWRRCDKFIEAGDWLVWRLTGREARSLDFAAYKAQYESSAGYPDGIAPGLSAKLSGPEPVGSAAGPLSNEWRERTGIRGEAVVAVAIIDSHVVLPAVGAYGPGVLVGALGTSAAYLLLDDKDRPMPPAIEGRAYRGRAPGPLVLRSWAARVRRCAGVVRANVSPLGRHGHELRRVQSGGFSSRPRAKPTRRDRLVERQSRALRRQEFARGACGPRPLDQRRRHLSRAHGQPLFWRALDCR